VSLLSQVTKGRIKLPHLIIVYGPDGVGKSTFGASAQSAIFLGTENGTNHIETASRLPAPKDYGMFLQALDELAEAKHEFKTLVLDSADWLDKLVQRKVCEDKQVDYVEEVGGGYGKGTSLVNAKWKDEVFSRLNRLREVVGMNIIILAHSQVKQFKDPQQLSDYNKHQLALPDTTAALFRQYVDAVLFANYEVFVKKEGGKARAFGDGARVLFTEGRPGFDAKNRLDLPFQLPLSWEEFERVLAEKEGDHPDTLIASIQSMLKELDGQSKIRANAEAKLKEFGTDPVKLKVLKNKVLAAIGAAA